jgi:hypothetical protein
MRAIRSALWPPIALVMASVFLPRAEAQAQAQARPAAQDRLAEIDKAFVCPEDLPDDPAREAALRGFFAAVGAAAPTMSVDDLIRFRLALLEKHHCAQTLRNIERFEAGAKQAPR